MAVGLSFESDWLRGWGSFFGQITWKNKVKPKESHITFNTALSKVPIKGKGVEIFEHLLAEIIFNPQE